MPQISIAQSDTVFNNKKEIIGIHQKKIDDLLNTYKNQLKKNRGDSRMESTNKIYS